MTIAQNVVASRLAEECFSLLSDFVRESTKDVTVQAKAWEQIGKMIAGVRDVPEKREVQPVGAMSDAEAKRFERMPFPFGKHGPTGTKDTVKDVPLRYLQWVDGDEFRADLRRYLLREEVWREQDDD